MILRLITILWMLFQILFCGDIFANGGYSVPVHFETYQNYRTGDNIIEKLSKNDNFFVMNISSDMKVTRNENYRLLDYLKGGNPILIDIEKNPTTKYKGSFQQLYSYYDGISLRYKKNLNKKYCDYIFNYSDKDTSKSQLITEKHRVNFLSNNQLIKETKTLSANSKPSNFLLNLLRYVKINKDSNELVYISEKDRLVYKYFYDLDLINTDYINFYLDPKIDSLNIKFKADGNKFLEWGELDKKINGSNITIYLRSSIKKKYPDIYLSNINFSNVEFVLFGKKNHKDPSIKPFGEYLSIWKNLQLDNHDFDVISNITTSNLKEKTWNYKFHDQIIEILNYGISPKITIESPDLECINYLDISLNQVDELLMPSLILNVKDFSDRLGVKNFILTDANGELIYYPFLLDYYSSQFDIDNKLNITSFNYDYSTQIASRVISKGTKIVFIPNGNLNLDQKIKLNFKYFSITTALNSDSNLLDLSVFDGHYLENIEVLPNESAVIDSDGHYEFFLINFKKLHPDQIFTQSLPNTSLNFDINYKINIYNNKNNILNISDFSDESQLFKIDYQFPNDNISPCIYINDINNALVDKLCFSNSRGVFWIKKNSNFYQRISKYNRLYFSNGDNRKFSISISEYGFRSPSIKSQLIENYSPSKLGNFYSPINLDINFFMDYIKGRASLYFIGNQYNFNNSSFYFQNNNIGKINKIEYYGIYNIKESNNNLFDVFKETKLFILIFIPLILLSYFLYSYKNSRFVNCSNRFLRFLVLIIFSIYVLFQENNSVAIFITLISLSFIFLFYSFILIKKYQLSYTYFQLNLIGSLIALLLMGIFYLFNLNPLSEAFGLSIFFFMIDSFISSLLDDKK